MRPGRIVALVIGCLLVLPALGLLFGGGALGLGYAFGRGDDGYFDTNLERLTSDSAAITADDITFASESGSPDWLLDTLDADARIRATNADGEQAVFVGIARQTDVDAYLAGVAHDEIIDIDDDLEPTYRSRSGSATIDAPTDESFWAASATGIGTQQLDWEAQSGEWAAIVMNADGSPGIAVDVNVGAKAAFLLPLSLIMLGAGAVLATAGVVLIIFGARGLSGAAEPADVAAPGHEPAVTPVAAAGAPSVAAAATVAAARPTGAGSPVTLTAQLDPQLSRWKWLVKWFLAIPHFIVLIFLALAFVVLTFVAGVSILFTGRYPRGIFDFNVGVLRWGWRVTFYCGNGGIGTDRYPPFSLHPEPGDPATLDIEYPEKLTQWGPLVKWLLAIPHLIIVGLLAGGSIRWLAFDGNWVDLDPGGGGGVLGLLVLVAGFVLLFTNRYPQPLFDLIVGLNRWVYRAVAYVALMTDTYPPFRLDQGGTEPGVDLPRGPGPGPAADTIDLRDTETEDRQASVSEHHRVAAEGELTRPT